MKTPRMIASHVAVGVAAFLCVWAVSKPELKSAGPTAGARAGEAPAPSLVSSRGQRPSKNGHGGLPRTREEFSAAWRAIAGRNLTPDERFKLQRAVFDRWAEVDLEGAIAAALDEPWDERLGAADLLRSRVMAQRSEDVWRLIQERRFGPLGGVLLMNAWATVLGRENPELFLGYIPEMKGTALRNSLHTYVEQINSAADARKVWESLAQRADWSEEEVAMLGDVAGTLAGFFPLEDLRAMTAQGEGPMTALACAALAQKLGWDQAKVDYSDEIAAIPEPMRDRFASELIAGFPPREATLAAVDQLVASGNWDELAREEVTWGVRRLATQMEPTELAEWAVSLPEKEEIVEMIHRGVEPLIQKNPEAAWDWISGLPDGMWRDRAFAEYSQQALNRFNDPEASRAALDQIQDPQFKQTTEQWRKSWEQRNGGK